MKKDKEKCKKIAEEICKKLLTNTVIEDYTINIESNEIFCNCFSRIKLR